MIVDSSKSKMQKKEAGLNSAKSRSTEQKKGKKKRIGGNSDSDRRAGTVIQ